MSKYLKDQITADLTRRLDGVADCVLANVIGLDSEKTFLLRKRLREKDIHVLVVKNTLARRATEGTSLGPAFEGIEGSSAIVWGGERGPGQRAYQTRKVQTSPVSAKLGTCFGRTHLYKVLPAQTHHCQ